MIVWIVMTAWIVTLIPAEKNPTGEYTYREAYGIEASSWFTSGTPGTCWEAGIYPKANADGTRAVLSDGQPAWKCVVSATSIDYRFWLALLNLLWVNGFLIAFGQCSLAGGAASWYFAPNDEKLSPSHTLAGIKNTFLYHQGSVAFGSLIVALVQLVKYYLLYLAKQAEQQHNPFMACVFRCLAYVVWCVEKCVKFMNKNAYIQIALLGKKFCTAMKDAFWLVFRNAGRIAAAGLISPIIHFFGMLTITVATTMFGVVMVRELYPTELNNPYNCGIFYFIEGYVCGRLVMNVFGMGVDTMLQCFVADEEINGQVGEHTPYELTAFLAAQGKKLKEEMGQEVPDEKKEDPDDD
jgi:hypothetical protein